MSEVCLLFKEAERSMLAIRYLHRAEYKLLTLCVKGQKTNTHCLSFTEGAQTTDSASSFCRNGTLKDAQYALTASVCCFANVTT